MNMWCNPAFRAATVRERTDTIENRLLARAARKRLPRDLGPIATAFRAATARERSSDAL